MPDQALNLALKQAKGKKFFFAFVPKGSDGKLIVSKKKIPPKEIADAKKEIGGGTPVTGKCIGEGNTMVFHVAKPTAPALAAIVKKVIHRDALLNLVAEFLVASDADADEPDAAAAGGAAAAAPKQTPPPAPPAPPAAGAAKTSPNAGALNLGPWQAARQEAIKDLMALAKKVAATKHGAAAGVLKEINSIIVKLPPNPAHNDIDKIEAFVRHDDTISAAEEVPGHFHKMNIRQPLLDALEGLKK
jgi:hypothetical protein